MADYAVREARPEDAAAIIAYVKLMGMLFER